MKKSSLLHSILFIFICMLPTRCSQDQWEGRIYKEQGVKVIESHGSGLWGKIIEDKIDFITELTIGEEVGGNHLLFHTDLDVAVDSNQNIYVLDKRNHRFMKFDSKGNHIWTSGRLGQGPGELQRPNKIKITPSKGICILDGTDKIHFYDLQGRYNHSISANRSIVDFQYTEDGRIFMNTPLKQQAGLSAVICDEKFELLEVFSIEYPYGPKIYGGGYVGGDIRYIQNKIYMLLPDIYEIREYDVDGTSIRKIRRDFKFTPPEVKRIGGGVSISGRTKLGPIYLLMSKYLVVQILQIVGENEQDIVLSFSLDFFNIDGKFLCSYKLPDSTRLQFIDSKNKFYFVTIDPVPRVIRSSVIID